MANHKEIYDSLCTYATERFKGFEVRYKDKSRAMRVLGKLVYVFNRRFMEDYTTVIGNKVYYPSRDRLESNYYAAWKTLAHELVHMDDRERNKLFGFLYLFPQVLSPLVLLAAILFQLSFPVYVLGVVLLAPYPAPFRALAEYRGYAMTIAIHYWLSGTFNRFQRARICRNFTGSAYYFMMPFKSSVEVEFLRIASSISMKRIFRGKKGRIFSDVFEILKKHGVVSEKVVTHA